MIQLNKVNVLQITGEPIDPDNVYILPSGNSKFVLLIVESPAYGYEIEKITISKACKLLNVDKLPKWFNE